MDNWGMMTKSQIDSEKIEEAVSRMIDEHNSSPEAHLGAGQSISVHREQEILDHKAGSVLADKWSFSELEFSTNFENLDAFFVLGSPSLLWPGFNLEPVGVGYANRGEVQVDGESGQIEIDFAKEQLFQVIFSADIASDGKIVFGLFGESKTVIKSGFGVEIIGGTMKFFTSNEAGNTFNELTFDEFEPLVTYVVRIFYSPVDDVVSCFVDGVLIGTLDWPSATWEGYAVCRFISINQTTSSPVLYLKSLFLKVSKP